MSSQIHIELNGVPHTISTGTTVSALLEGISHPHVFALEYNGAILPAEEFAGTIIQDHSKIEIVQFVGGG